MVIKNHMGDEVDVQYVKRRKKDYFYNSVKAVLANGQVEYWNYTKFNEHNPNFNWDE